VGIERNAIHGLTKSRTYWQGRTRSLKKWVEVCTSRGGQYLAGRSTIAHMGCFIYTTNVDISEFGRKKSKIGELLVCRDLRVAALSRRALSRFRPARYAYASKSLTGTAGLPNNNGQASFGLALITKPLPVRDSSEASSTTTDTHDFLRVPVFNSHVSY